ncbi:MAG: DNA primase [Culicoidibacterales bacterium]
MRIPELLIQEIREKVDIVAVIGDYIALEKRGRNHIACCPFHEEKTPSFSVSEDKQIFYCFGCHQGGNVYNFLMKHEGLSFIEAVTKVANYTDIDLQQYTLESPIIKKENPLTPYLSLNEFVCDFYAYMLQTDRGTDAKKYLHSRGISDEEIKHFNIGFAPNEHLLASLLTEKGYSLDLAQELGLLHEAKSLTHFYDSFAGRIVFPITNFFGEVVAFTGRIITESKTAPKYYHSPESVIFQKRSILYNYSNVSDEIRKQKHVFLCEGIFDVIALHRAGISIAVASLGTALTEEQVQYLKQKKVKATFIFDNDNAGKSALVKAINISLKHQLPADVVTFWEYGEKDLDEISQVHGAGKVKLILEHKTANIDYLLQYYQSFLNIDNNEERQEFARHILEALQHTPRATKEFYYEKLQTITNYSISALTTLQQQVQKTKSGQLQVNDHDYAYEQYPVASELNLTTRAPKGRQLMCELLIIKSMCNDESCIKIYQGMPVLSQNEVFRKLIYQIVELFRKKKCVDLNSLYDIISDKEAQFLSQALYLEEPISSEIFTDLLKTLKHISEKRFFQEGARDRTNDKEKQKEMLQKYMEFKIKNN